MEELIVSVVSLVVLVPIIYFLPLGLSNKGKGVLILVAFLNANLGLVAKNNFPLGQTALIILLLIILTVYILEKRLNKLLYTNLSKEETSSAISFEEPQDIEQVEKEISISPEELNKEKLVVDEVEEIEPIEISLSKEVELEEIGEIVINDNLIEKTPVVADFDEKADGNNALNQDEVEWDEEIAFLESREVSPEEVQSPFEKDDAPAVTSGYMSEIELLIESDDLEEELDKEEVVLASLDNEQNDSMEDSFIEMLEDLELEEVEFEENDVRKTVETYSKETTSEEDLIPVEEIEEIGFIQPIEEEVEDFAESENDWMLDDLDLGDITLNEDEIVPLEVLLEIEAVELEVAASVEEEEEIKEFVEDIAEEGSSDENLLSYDEKFDIPANISFESEPKIEEIDLAEPSGEIELESESPISTEEPQIEDEELESELPIIAEEPQFEEDVLESKHPITTEESQPEKEEELDIELPILEEPKLLEEELESELPISTEEPQIEDEELESELPISTEEPQLDEEELESELPILAEVLKPEDEKLENEQPINIEASSIENEELPAEETEPIPVVEQEQKSALQQQLFHTMVSQLHISRKHMSSEAYEELIKEHLHPGLPKQDYYTFESLLVQHYISHKELGKLEQLLTDMSGKYTKYPILDMEIHYLYKQYCEKTR